MSSITVVLNQPKYPENIGSAVRAAYNMGIERLLVVRSEKPDYDLICKTATHNAATVVDSICYFTELDEALAHFSLVVGTTARQGRQRQANILPCNLAGEILPQLQRGGKIALLFGAENTGLTNDDLQYCGLLCTIPTADFSSLNLAQSVAIVCYEVFQGLLAEGGSAEFVAPPRPATVAERLPMYEVMAQVLRELDVSVAQGKAATRDYHLRRLLNRYALSAREAVVLKELCCQILKTIR